jgi:F-type H+-transporting ATPase subunit delta
MATKDDRTKGYARALFDVAKAEGVLDDVEDEMFRFARTLEHEIRLRDALIDPNLPADHRAKMVDELLGTRATQHTRNFIAFVVQQGRARDLSAIVDALVALVSAERKKGVAEVRSAVPLDAAQREKLRKALERATGKKLELKVFVDPSVMGGLVATVGDMVFDASIRRRLQVAREHFGR